MLGVELRFGGVLVKVRNLASFNLVLGLQLELGLELERIRAKTPHQGLQGGEGVRWGVGGGSAGTACVSQCVVEHIETSLQHPGDFCINIHLSFMNNYEAVVQNGKCSFTAGSALLQMERCLCWEQYDCKKKSTLAGHVVFESLSKPLSLKKKKKLFIFLHIIKSALLKNVSMHL